MIRDLEISDLVILEKENLPSLFNGPYRLVKSIDHNGKLIGSFWVRVTTEISVLLKPELSNFTKARAIKELGEFLDFEIPFNLGISDAIIILDDPVNESFARTLKKHFKFEDIRAMKVRSSV